MTRDEARMLMVGDEVGTQEWNRFAAERNRLPGRVKIVSVRTGQVSQTGVMLVVEGHAAPLDAGWFEVVA